MRARLDRSRAALDPLLLHQVVAAPADLAAYAYGSVRATIELVGTPIGPPGTLIAGHAVGLSVVPMTHNVAAHGRVEIVRRDGWLKWLK